MESVEPIRLRNEHLAEVAAFTLASLRAIMGCSSDSSALGPHSLPEELHTTQGYAFPNLGAKSGVPKDGWQGGASGGATLLQSVPG